MIINLWLIIAEHLSARLLILQCVFAVGGVWLWVPSRFRNSICHASGMQLKLWLVRKHPSRFGMQLKYLVYKKLSTLMQVYHSQRYSGTSGLMVATTKWQKMWWEWGRGRSLAWKQKRRQRVQMQLQCREVHFKNDQYEREQHRLVKQIKRLVFLSNDHILAFCAVQNRTHILETLST